MRFHTDTIGYEKEKLSCALSPVDFEQKISFAKNVKHNISSFHFLEFLKCPVLDHIFVSFRGNSPLKRTVCCEVRAFQPQRLMLGGKLRAMLICGAAANEESLRFARCVFGVEVFECYGTTEASSLITSTLRTEWETGTPNITNLFPRQVSVSTPLIKLMLYFY